jgi:hypothetical protein
MTSRRPPLTIESLVATPDHYLFAFEADQAIFAAMDRGAYRRSIFLDRRIQAASPETVAVPVDALVRYVDRQPLETRASGWIFHIAHCGSTLLSRALDRPDQSLVLREPLALRQLGVARAQMADAAPAGDWQARLRLATSLHGRRYRPDAPAIVKANVPVNFMLSQILEMAPAAPAILLYFPLRPYLLAILRSPQHRNWVMNVTGQVQPALARLVGGLEGSSLPERAAALWLAQMRLYAEALERFAGTKSLHAEDLFNAPLPILAAAAAHLGVRIPERDLEAVVAGDLFSTYSKAPAQAFDNARRLEVRAETSRLFGAEIDQARRWVEQRLASCPIPPALDRPLAGSSPRLLDD